MRRIRGRVPRARAAAGSLLSKLLRRHPIRRAADGPAEQPRVDLSVTNLDITREDLSIRTVSIERVGHPRRFVVSTNPHDAPPIAIRN
jgi:hypothetical protein